MSRKLNALDRYQRINDLFNLRKGAEAFVTTKELVEELGVSVRQLRTDMEEMRRLGAPLQYIARERGWRYTEPFDFSESIPLSAEDIMQLRLAVATLAEINNLPEFSKIGEIFEKIRGSVRRWVDQEATAKAIYFEPLPHYEGGVHLSFFLRAIEETKQVCFDYKPFYAAEPRGCTLDPYFLRRHRQRWYVGGLSHDPEEGFIRTYPLERVVGEPQFSGRYFDKPKDFNPPDYWRHIVGINRPPDSKVERVVLEFSRIQGQYFLSKPFFSPFIILEDTPDKLVVEMELMIEIELTRRIASYGKDVRVLHPPVLVESLKKFFREALELA